MKRRYGKKLLSLLMALTMAAGTLPAPALAAVGDSLNRTNRENQAILEQLSALTGGDSEEARALLESLGLLDSQGKLNVSQSLELDGERMTLAEVLALLEDPAADLTATAEVDGTSITLGDLKTMIRIEQELQRIQETYFSGRTFTGESLDNLNSLLTQLETQGITLNAGAGTVRSNALDLTGSYLLVNTNALTLLDGVYQNTPILDKKITVPAGTVASFRYRVQDGSLGEGMLDPWVTVIRDSDGKQIHVKAFNTDLVEMSGGETGETFTVTVAVHVGSSEFNQLHMGQSGQNQRALRGYVEFYDMKNMTFFTGDQYLDYFQLPVTVDKGKPFVFKNRAELDWKTTAVTASRYERGMTGGGGGTLDEYTTPRWYLWQDLQEKLDHNQEPTAQDYADQTALQYTADQIYGKNHVYEIEASLGLWGVNLKAYPAGNPKPTGGYLMRALPRPYDSNAENRQPFQIQDYYWESNHVLHDQSKGQIHNHINGQTGYTGNPFIKICPSKSDMAQVMEWQTVRIVAGNDQGKVPGQLIANWPVDPILVESPAADPYQASSDVQFGGDCGQYLDSCTISLYDDQTGPTVTGITVPEGVYRTGMLVPITLTFSEPVKLNNAQLCINGTNYTGQELMMTESGKTAVAWYEVKDVDAQQLTVSGITNVTDLFETPIDTTQFEAVSAPGVTLESALMRNAVNRVSVSYADGTASVTLDVNQEEAYRTKYTDTSFSVEVLDGEGRLLASAPCTLTESGSNTIVPVATVEGLTPAAVEQNCRVVVRAYEDSADPGWLCSAEGSFTIPAVVPVTGVSIEADRATDSLSITDAYRPKLTVTVEPENASHKTGSWSSSDAEIAAVNAAGDVVLGSKVGTVTLTYTADNGTPETTDDKSASITYTVAAGSSPALVIPENASTILVRKDDPATVLWSSNAAHFGSKEFTYTVQVFKGNYETEQALDAAISSGLTPVFTAEAPRTANSLIIPENTLTSLSAGGDPAYTVRVSMPHPKAENATLSALAYIVVNPQPAGARLTPPASLYLTDDQTASIGWTVKNFVTDAEQATDAVLTVTRVTGDSQSAVYDTETVREASGTYVLHPQKVADGLKETYMVTLSVQNQGDAAPDVDAFPLYVYRAGALALEQEGKPVSHLTMDNSGIVDGYTPESQSASNTSGSEALLALREELALIEYVSINYGDYSWSQLNDRIRWATSNPDVSVNYKQGGLYEDIQRFGLDTYLPETKMALSSVTDGTAVITATHANTGMSASVTVDVRTLRDKFFLFQLTPMMKTALTYTDGKGEEKTVITNDEGMLALYEPDGIASNIALKADVDGKVYLGTIYQDNLLSGERDATKLMLYPLNTFKMRQVAQVDLSLTKPDGTPYSGSVTLRGGVYKNEGYCQDAMLGDKPSNAGKVSGVKGKTVTVTDGRLPIYLDSTQFWSEELGEASADAKNLKATDRLQYIFELTGVDGDAYYPMLVYANGNLSTDDLMRSAGSVLTLEEVPAGEAEKPFLSNQFMDYGLTGGRLIDVRHSTGHIGPNSAYPTVTLRSTVLLWGEEKAQGYEVLVADEFGYTPKEQKSQIQTYPFSTIPVVSNDLTLSQASITDSGWVADGKDVGLRIRLRQGQQLLREKALDFRLMDMTRVEKVTESDKVSNMLIELTAGSGVSQGNGGGNGNVIIDTLGRLLGGLSGPINGTNFKMIISPSADNTKFNAFVWAGYDSVGLDDVDYSETGVALDYGLLEGELSAAPSLNDIADMARGSSDANQGQQSAPPPAAGGSKWDSAASFGGQLEGYYEAEIAYNFDEEQWEIYTLGGGFTAGFSGGASFGINTFVGPVPVFAELGLGGAVQLDFKAAVRYAEQDGLVWANTVTSDTVNDYLTTLRLNAYVNAFGGIGMDYAIVSLKIGLFGGLNVDNSNLFLSRTYLADESARQLNGQRVGVGGEVGIKFEVGLLSLLTYECVLASGSAGYSANFNDLDRINNYWTNTGSGRSLSQAAIHYAALNNLRVAGSSAALQSRDYLEEYDRVWGGVSLLAQLFSLDEDNGMKNLQTNANPAAYPVITADGQRMAYVSDQSSTSVYDSRVYAGRLSGGSYTPGEELPAPGDFTGYGDSGLSLAGGEDFAAAAWVRLSDRLPDKDAGAEVTLAEQNLLMNSSEIVASVYEDGRWVSTRLTTNGTPDLAPVVASNGAGKAVAVWRSVYTGDPGTAGNDGENNLLDFTGRDTILYSVYENGSWSAPRELYNGSAGAVKALQAAMLPDGTAMAVYTLDRNPADTSYQDYEIAYTLIDAKGDPGLTMIPTGNDCLDENPQIAAVHFGSGDDRFVLGWHSVEEGVSDIRLLAVDGQGAMSNSFPASIAQVVEQNPVTIGGEFRFAKMAEPHNRLTDLAILWPEQVTTPQGETDHSMLKAVKFRKTPEGAVGLSAALEVAELENRTLLDHFEAYVSGPDQVKAVLQGTWYDPTNTEKIDGVAVAKEESRLYTATGDFANKAVVTGLTADYANLALNSPCGVQFTLFNAGLEEITSAEIQLGGKTYAFDGLALAPNESRTLTVWHPVGNQVENPAYTVTATFGTDEAYVAAHNETLYLDYPDVGISQIKTVSESEGKRTVRMTLYNQSAAKLAGSGREVSLRFCTDGLYETLVDVTCGSGAAVKPDKTLTVSGDRDLALIDQGAYTLEVTFDVGKFVKEKNFTEIPDSGVRLFTKASVLEGDRTLPEYNSANNESSVRFDSLLKRTGESMTLDTEQQTADGKTKAVITLKNNSLQPQSSGSILATLLDANGAVLEQKQTSIPAGTLAGEAQLTDSVTFSKTGSRVTAVYGTLDGKAELTSLTFEGLPVRLSDFTDDGSGRLTYALHGVTANTTLITAAAGSADTPITINGQRFTGSGSLRAAIPTGTTAFEIVCGDRTYVLTVSRQGGSSGGGGGGGSSTYPITVPETLPGGSLELDPKRAEQGDAVTVTAKPDAGLVLERLTVSDAQGRPLELTPKGPNRFTFVMPASGVTVEAAFGPGNPFTDVRKSDHFYEAVLWAVKNGVTTGITETTFGPHRTCTRAQAVTFLWRAMGSPKPVSDGNPFVDVAPDAYYHDAILWAVENGVTKGVTATAFEPDATVKRSHAVAFLWRTAGSPAAQGENPFTDVAPDTYYHDGVLWAVKNGVTNGTTETTFSPGANCTRGQIVKFLFGYFHIG